MKKFLAIALALILALGMVACSTPAEAPAEEPAAETPAEEAPAEEAPAEEAPAEEAPAEEATDGRAAREPIAAADLKSASFWCTMRTPVTTWPTLRASRLLSLSWASTRAK